MLQEKDLLDILMDILQMFRDKKTIFCLTCELLGQFLNHSSEIKTLLLTSDYLKRMESVLGIIERKHRLESKVKNLGNNANNLSIMPFLGSPNNKYLRIPRKDPIDCLHNVLRLLGKMP